jgi:hypothetical protein
VNRQEEIRAKARRIAPSKAAPSKSAGTAAASAEAPPSRPARRPGGTVRTDPVRITTDLPPADHMALIQWCAATAAELGRPRVHGQDVVRALVERLLADETLAEQVRDALADRYAR